jgi:hypothetical protein
MTFLSLFGFILFTTDKRGISRFVSLQSWAFAKAACLKPAKAKLDPVKAGPPCEFSVWLNQYSQPGDCVMFLDDTDIHTARPH